jgi:hypothetical protein
MLRIIQDTSLRLRSVYFLLEFNARSSVQPSGTSLVSELPLMAALSHLQDEHKASNLY